MEIRDYLEAMGGGPGTSGVLMPTRVRTGAPSPDDLPGPVKMQGARGILMCVDIHADDTFVGLTIKLRSEFPIPGDPKSIVSVSNGINQVGRWVYLIHPQFNPNQLNTTELLDGLIDVVPPVWSLYIEHSSADPIEYGISYWLLA